MPRSMVVIGFPALASTSAEQGRLAACHAFSTHEESAPEFYPLGIYAVPEISIVGKTEQQLREAGVARLRETARVRIQGVQEGRRCWPTAGRSSTSWAPCSTTPPSPRPAKLPPSTPGIACGRRSA
ncbi:MAG: hypothetical protein EXR82_03445 [Gammaproteobacteria bacterium]|nr:hypothetical protein [Gammaproteobacteria bacterium]